MSGEPLKGQVALVTGAASGIGAGVAKSLGAAGASVAINYVTNPEAADAVAAEVQALGGKAMTLRADVSNEDDVREMFRALLATWGSIDILVNNAGLQKDAPFTDMTLAQWSLVIETHVTGTFNFCQAILGHMVTRNSGAIVITSSDYAIVGVPKAANYCAAKTALYSLTKSLALDLGKEGIRFNTIMPGWTVTERVQDLMAFRAKNNHTTTEEEFARQTAEIPLGRMGEPQEFANAAVFLVSPAASFIHGVALAVDGGIIKATL